MSFPTSTPVLISTPISFMTSISAAMMSFPSLYEGIPYRSIPPASAFFSNTVGLYPFSAKKNAVASPEGPPPIIATFSFHPSFNGDCVETGITFFGIYLVFLSKSLSARNFLIASIDTALSIVPRVQAASHRLLQIRPQTAGNGFFFLISARASS